MITPITIRTECFVSDINGLDGADLSEYVSGGGIEVNIDRTTKVTGECVFVDMPRNVFDALSDFLHIYLRITGADGEEQYDSLGVFVADLPSVDINETFEVIEVRLYDLSVLLSDTTFEEPFDMLTGTKYTDAMIQILEMAGFTRYSVVDSTKTFTADETFWPGMDLLEAFNTLASSIGYYTLTVDNEGIPESYPYINIDSAQPYATLTADDFLGKIIKSPHTAVLPNRVVAYYNQPDAEPLTAIRNLPDDHPLSAANRNGRVVTQFVPLVQAESQEVVDATADSVFQQIGGEYTVIQYTTLPRTGLRVRETVKIDLHAADDSWCLCGHYFVRTWAMGFTPRTAPLRVEANRTVASHGV